ncbi:anthranilate synthase component I family protein [Schlesneria sp. T3-172]|uniref:anthranilate synthase component I family protein n=1 Tax=Schlesneria sphaerica TaxID=3373610 RepID=UPI0037C539E0
MTAITFPLVEELSPSTDVMSAVEALADWPNLLLFESALQRRGVGRYTFLMADPINRWELDRSRYGIDPFEQVRAAWKELPTARVAGLPPFQGGIAGLLGYELGQSWERIPTPTFNEFNLPVLAVGLYDWVIAWDHELHKVWLVSQGWPEREPDRRAFRAADRIRNVQAALAAGRARPDETSPLPRKLELADQFPLPSVPHVSSTFTREGYLRAVERVIEYIQAGDIFQANLSQRLLAPAPCGPVSLYRRLRSVNPAPFAGLMVWNDWAIVSASPERFLWVQDGEVETRPIKGTRQRKRGPEADLFTRDELRQSEKDQAENVMIVDLLRNDLSRVCLPSTVRVPQLCTVETYETVQHLVSAVTGQLKPELSIWDLFQATFPGGSITGAPKVRAMEIIAELEPTVRGPYCGSLFYVGADGQADSNLLIRSYVQRHGWLQCNVGGGIVAQSDSKAEYEETLTKAAGMLKAL